MNAFVSHANLQRNIKDKYCIPRSNALYIENYSNDKLLGIQFNYCAHCSRHFDCYEIEYQHFIWYANIAYLRLYIFPIVRLVEFNVSSAFDQLILIP